MCRYSLSDDDGDDGKRQEEFVVRVLLSCSRSII